MLPNQAIASTPSAPRPSGAEGRGSTDSAGCRISTWQAYEASYFLETSYRPQNSTTRCCKLQQYCIIAPTAGSTYNQCQNTDLLAHSTDRTYKRSTLQQLQAVLLLLLLLIIQSRSLMLANQCTKYIYKMPSVPSVITAVTQSACMLFT
jgi:hypothetical protein